MPTHGYALTNIENNVIELNSFGSMYGHNISQLVEIVSSDTYVEVGGGLSAGHLSNFAFQNAKELVCNQAGKYLVVWQMSITNSANVEVEGSILINGVECEQCTAHNTIQTSNVAQSFNGCCIEELAEGDVISLGLSNHTNVSDFVVEHANLSLVKVAN